MNAQEISAILQAASNNRKFGKPASDRQIQYLADLYIQGIAKGQKDIDFDLRQITEMGLTAQGASNRIANQIERNKSYR